MDQLIELMPIPELNDDMTIDTESRDHLPTWQECQRLTWIRFGQVETELVYKYDDQIDPREHV